MYTMTAMTTKSIVLLVLLASAAATTETSTVDRTDKKRRVLHNSETGAITYPLIPHAVHLERRRRELRQSNGGTAYDDVAEMKMPPRPHTSRHSSPSANHSDPAFGAVRDRLLRAGNVDGHADRRLQQQMGALYQGYGTHYVDLWVGTPTPQRQTVIVDTGSGVTAFPCSGCKDCGKDYHTDNYFVETKSKTFKTLNCKECRRGYCATMNGEKKCRISMSYAEGSSWSAYEGVDTCYAGGPHDQPLEVFNPLPPGEDYDHVRPTDASEFAFELAFGCQVSITGLFITQLADGIMGMENDKTAFWKQMHEGNAIPRPEFSLCFSRQNDADASGTGAGAMTLGGVDPRLHTTPMVFADNVKKVGGFYALHLKGVYIREGGGTSAQVEDGDKNRIRKLNVDEGKLNRGNVIVDSGTTDTYFTSAIAGEFKKVWKEITGTDYNHKSVSLTDEELGKLPTILFVVKGKYGDGGPSGNPDDIPGYVGSTDALEGEPKDIVLALPASHYMEYDPDDGKYVPRFYVEEASGSVLGANVMMGHDVYFDVGGEQVGFAESSCDYDELLSLEGSVSVVPEKKASGGQTTSTKTEVQPDEGFDEPASEPTYEEPGYEEPAGGWDTGDTGDANSGKATSILSDMEHSCETPACRSIAALSILLAIAVVTVVLRRAVARRRVVRQYQEAELEISDLALDDDSDHGGYADEPPSMRQIT